jgi:nucleoid-associated protein YejK
VDHEQFKYYVDQLTKVSNGTCGGLAVSIDAEGLRAAVVFDDIRDQGTAIYLRGGTTEEREIQTLEKSIENEVTCKTKSKGYER